MDRIIENEFLRVKVKDMGAELAQIFNKKTGKDLLWSGDAAWWNRTSPLLFPSVGKSKNGQYTYKGKTYEMTPHGFARDYEFSLISEDGTSVTHKLLPNETIAALYPFSFALTVTHALEGNKLKITWMVENTGDVTLPFAIGGHSAFMCAPVSGDFAVSALLFDKSELSYQMVDGPLVDNTRKYAMKLQNGVLPITKELFEKDVLIFPDSQVSKISILENGKPHLTVDFKGFPFVGIWTKPGAPFVCIEPWYGVADSTDADGDMEHKRGNQLLAAGRSFTASHYVIAE